MPELYARFVQCSLAPQEPIGMFQSAHPTGPQTDQKNYPNQRLAVTTRANQWTMGCKHVLAKTKAFVKSRVLS